MTRSPGRLRLLPAVVSLALCLAGGVANAEPGGEPTADAVTRFLTERGLIDPQAGDTSLAQQVRARASDWTSDLVLSAMNFLGVRYRRGGETAEQGFDCSGFTRHVFEASVGLVLPRRSNEQAKAPGLLDVNRDELKPGDLVFFNTLRTAFSHVGIYVGDGKFIHAPRTGGKVRVEDMRVAYWSKRYNGARRAPQPADAIGTAPTPPTLPATVPALQPAIAVGATALNSSLTATGH
ncbi:C40 family peptidase [Methylibium sp.]|uniref:C40 family peptidase n=1 Tax=Methylibium sp. TaxID=2067992 RepID=UPI003D0FEDA7